MSTTFPGDSGAPQTASASTFVLAPWLTRVGATLLDGIISIPVLLIGAAVDRAAGADGSVQSLFGLAYWLVQLYLQGTSGSTLGKRIVGISVVRESDAAPTGFLIAVVRAIAHILDAIPVYIGYLWPLWDKKKQTFADKILKTVVVKK